MAGFSTRYGPRQVAQKFNNTTLPRRSEMKAGFPSKSESLKFGAGVPTCGDMRVAFAACFTGELAGAPYIRNRSLPCGRAPSLIPAHHGFKSDSTRRPSKNLLNPLNWSTTAISSVISGSPNPIPLSATVWGR